MIKYRVIVALARVMGRLSSPRMETPIDREGRAAPPRPIWLDAAALAAVFAGLTAWSWGTWPDVLVDFGRELYVAWRLAEGDVLYRDVASFYGPFSPYVNGALFRLVGAGLQTLVVANLVVLASTTALLHALLSKPDSGIKPVSTADAVTGPLCTTRSWTRSASEMARRSPPRRRSRWRRASAS